MCDRGAAFVAASEEHFFFYNTSTSTHKHPHTTRPVVKRGVNESTVRNFSVNFGHFCVRGRETYLSLFDLLKVQGQLLVFMKSHGASAWNWCDSMIHVSSHTWWNETLLCCQCEFSKQTMFLFYLISGSFAARQRVTVKKGQTLTLRCPRRNPQHTIEWKTPEGYVMFIKHDGGEDHQQMNEWRHKLTDDFFNQDFKRLHCPSPHSWQSRPGLTRQALQHHQTDSVWIHHQCFQCHVQRWRHLHLQWVRQFRIRPQSGGDGVRWVSCCTMIKTTFTMTSCDHRWMSL